MTFKELGLNETILKAIDKEGYEIPTPIQEATIPHILNHKDVLGCAQTGTGKTAAFALPLIQELMKETVRREIRVLVLTPTRELALQIRDNFRKYSVDTNLKCSVVLGGVNQASQVEVLKNGVDILVATPGRLLDLINQRYVKLNNLKTLVLDEADTMLDMGFINDVKKIISHVPSERQTLLFSATMPKEIIALAESLLKNHVTVRVNNNEMTVPKINQLIYYVDKANKTRLLIDILKKEDIKSALVFSRTKHGANKLSEILSSSGISSGVIHGNKSQNARVNALNDFKTGRTKILIATDIAARGIDIIELSHVINYEMPEAAETYVHRIGRTGRAGLTGTAISLCNIDEKSMVGDVQRLTKQNISVVEHEYPMVQLTLSHKEKRQGSKRPTNKPKVAPVQSGIKPKEPFRSNNKPFSRNANPKNNFNNFSRSNYGKKAYKSTRGR